MQFPCKTLPPHIIMYLVVVISSILASSLVVSMTAEDKKWMYDTLLFGNSPGNPSPTYTPQQFGVLGPAPIPRPTQWNSAYDFGYRFPSVDIPSVRQNIQNSKRSYRLGRLSSFGLLCCNQPPTRPPRMKRPNNQDTRWKQLLFLMNSLNDKALDNIPERPVTDEQSKEIDQPYRSYLGAAENSHQPEVQRRGATNDFGYQVPSVDIPSVRQNIHSSKRSYRLGRGLLCCNQPPTRPPRMKRPKNQDTRGNRLLLLMNSLNDKTLDNVPERPVTDEQSKDIDQPYRSYLEAAEDSHQPEVQRRGVTVIKSGVSGTNTG